MPADRALVAVSPVRARAFRLGARCADPGFSLVEVMVSIVVIGTVMAAAAPFLVRSVMVVGQQRSQQVAIEVANDALERARALDPSSLLAGRGKAETQRQWNAAPPAVATELTAMFQVWDPLLPVASDAGRRAPLPTADKVTIVGGTAFAQSWYVGRCWQPKVPRDQSTVGACGPAQANSTDVPFFRIVAAVAWTHRSCADAQCVYVAMTLASTSPDPRFDVNRPPPTIGDPGDQTGHVGVARNLQLFSSGGRIPLVWSAPALPPGLTVTADGGLITGAPTLAGTYSVVVTATDRDNRSDDTRFSWLIVERPTLTTPGDQTSLTGAPLTLALTATPGLPPMVWSATGLPAGLTLNASTGVITGTPTTVQAPTVVVTVTDTGSPPQTASVTFVWRVLPELKLVDPGPRTFGHNAVIGRGYLTISATGGTPPYRWQAVGLPGLTIEPDSGAILGRVTNRKDSYPVTITVTDSAGDVESVAVVWTVS